MRAAGSPHAGLGTSSHAPHTHLPRSSKTVTQRAHDWEHRDALVEQAEVVSCAGREGVGRWLLRGVQCRQQWLVPPTVTTAWQLLHSRLEPAQ